MGMVRHKKHDGGKSHKHRLGVFMLVFFVVVLAAAVVAPTIYVNVTSRQQRYELSRVSIQDIPKRETAIVLGAGLRNNGKDLSPYLQWRVNTAVKLYKAGKVSDLLMTGDGGHADHDEPAVMRREAIRQGVPASKIVMDKFGFDTYDSCTRAKKYRAITSAIVVTQGYHLPRAVYSCRVVGIDAIGVNAQTEAGRGWSPYALAREWLSTDKLFVQLGVQAAREKASGL